MRRLIKALLILQVCQVIGFARSLGAGEAKPNWQAEWDRTVRAAEQEGQVMVSIGGYGAIIDSGVFQKLYPKIKITHITGAGTDLTAAHFGGAPRRQISCRCLQRRRQLAVSGSLCRQDARPDQVGVDPAGCDGCDEMVGGQTEVRGQRRSIYFCLRGQRVGRRGRVLQQPIARSARVQELLGFAQS